MWKIHNKALNLRENLPFLTEDIPFECTVDETEKIQLMLTKFCDLFDYQ